MLQIEMGPTRLPEGDLVERSLRGEAVARESLARQARDKAYVFALQLTGDPHRSQDIAQDSVVRFLDSLDRFDPDRPLDPWLFQITRNRLRDVLRREAARATESLDADRDGRRYEVADHDADPLGAVIRTELQKSIWTEMAQLSETQREIIVLRDHHGLTYREIAEVLAVPAGTVMSRLHAARTALRARLIANGTRPHQDDAEGGVT